MNDNTFNYQINVLIPTLNVKTLTLTLIFGLNFIRETGKPCSFYPIPRGKENKKKKKKKTYKENRE